LRHDTGLPFRPHEKFAPEDQLDRQELYIRIAEWVWNPSRLDLDGVKPPVPEPIVDPDEASADVVDRPDRHDARLAFFTALLSQAKGHSDLHANISPSRYHWVGTRRHGHWWNYVVLQDQTRVEFYIDGPVVELIKEFFDRLHDQREEIEGSFSGELHWQRLDDKRACRISHTVSGGWVDADGWPKAIDDAVDAMTRLYGALSSPVAEAQARSD
jgi:uncharacterized protein DUF4268